MKAAFLTIVLFAGIASCIVLKGWDEAPKGWQIDAPADADREITFRIALKQRNLDKLDAALNEVVNQKSPKFGKHWTKEAITALVSPPAQDTQQVISWLSANGIVDVENYGDALKVSAKVGVVQTAFQTLLYKFSHRTSPRTTVVRLLGEFTIPDAVNERIEFISSLYDFPKPRKALRTRGSQTFGEPTDDGVNVYPQLINYLYNVPANVKANAASSLCLAEFQNQDFPSSFSYSDLQAFFQQMSMKYHNVSVIVGDYNPPDNLAEATLDVSYGAAISQGTTVWYWTVQGWIFDFANELYNRKSVPWVVSMSWGWPEPWECSNGTGTCPGGVTAPVYIGRVNGEFKKASLRGVSLLAASGDQGAPGDENPSCANPDKPMSDIFPGGSPYVLSIGATMLNNPNTGSGKITEPPICQQQTCANTPLQETACSIPTALITSGGGFTAYDSQPSWQVPFVSKYLTASVPMPPHKYFNASHRAFPDVSALGHGYIISWNGQWTPVDGTSASTPVWAALVSMVNSARLNIKKSYLGWLPPHIYAAATADPTIFNDITTGNNLCTEYCCTNNYGYYATKGWDPVTGLGSPNFPKLLNYLVNKLP